MGNLPLKTRVFSCTSSRVCKFMVSRKLYFFLAISVLLFVGITNRAQGAVFYFSPPSGSFTEGTNFVVSLKIDSEGEAINAAEGRVQFPKALLEVSKVEFTDSIFNFWVDEPAFSNEEGTLKFLGGTNAAVAGAALQTFRIVFRAKAAGQATLSLTDAAITLGDGSGTNVLRESRQAMFTLKEKGLPLASPTPTPRVPVRATRLPSLPKIEVPLYPDQERWYNTVAPFAGRWTLPPDVAGVSTALNKDPNFIPQEKSEGAFETKDLPQLEEGIWYFHVRFQNNLGWGPTAHSRIRIDTTPPVLVAAEFPEGPATDNPRPKLAIRASDALAGISHYRIRVGSQVPFQSQEPTPELPRQAPGKYTVSVRAFDLAGNAREGKLDLEILPIVAPEVHSISSILLAGEDSLVVRGSALPQLEIHFSMKEERTRKVFTGQAKSDEDGNWTFDSGRPFAKGVYFVTLFAQDERGAVSLPVEAGVVLIREKPLLAVGSISLTTLQVLFLVAFLVLILGVFLFIWWQKRKGRLLLKTILLQYDIAKLPQMMKKDLDLLEGHLGRKDSLESVVTSAMFIVKRMRQTIERMEGFLKKEAEGIKEK